MVPTEPTILAIDTATGACSVALSRGANRLAREQRLMERGHAEALAPMIARALKTAGLAPSALDAVAVTRGPGAFTGLRIGLAMARAMAQALGVPCIGVTTLAAVAREAARHTGGAAVLACIESRRATVYAQAFLPDGTALGEAAACDAAGLASRLAQLAATGHPVMLAGDAAVRARAMLAPGAAIAIATTTPPDPVDVAALAATRWSAGQPTEAPLPEPLYLRPPEAQLPPRGGRARA